MNNQTKKPKSINVLLWIAQSLVALFFIASGASHLTMPLEKLIPMAPWTKDVSLTLIKVHWLC